ncbi:MAG: hypothetical protein GX362_05535 [Methanosarcinaceae archaeon]|nr:hypothetical protein [Methanosarcinaceae archaeon]
MKLKRINKVGIIFLILLIISVPAYSKELGNEETSEIKNIYQNNPNLKDINVSDDALFLYSTMHSILIDENSEINREIFDVEKDKYYYYDEDISILIPHIKTFVLEPGEEDTVYSLIEINPNEKEKIKQEEYLKDFRKKYPTKYVTVGIVTFISVENKEELLENFTESDAKMFESIYDLNKLNSPLYKRKQVADELKEKYYNKEILGDVYVTDENLDIISEYHAWLLENDEFYVDEMVYTFYDDDLKSLGIEYQYIVPYPEDNIDRAMNTINLNKNETEKKIQKEYIIKLREKYPAKFVRSGINNFVTIENKQQFLKEFSSSDKEIFTSISKIENELIEKKQKEKIRQENSTPGLLWLANAHYDMARNAAIYNNFTESQQNVVAIHAPVPDTWLGPIIRNIYHYCGPINITIPIIGTITKDCDCAATEVVEYSDRTKQKEKTFESLGYCSHFISDISNSLHTDYAIAQVINAIDEASI